jgi:pyridoxamine 5'-phosphate oxidase
MLFFWPGLQRQIRIEGTVRKVSSEDSDAYFASRPRESQLGAWASNQSEVLENRDDLISRLEEFDLKFPDVVPRPSHWGGYEMKPTTFEFWQGRPSRLHDRLVFQIEGDHWKIFRKNP